MRELVSKYVGSCRKCDADIAIGTRIVYEKRIGIFCLACAPTDTEEIRAYRQEGADRKAAKYEEWAAKRREKATKVFDADQHYTGDLAFNTQPGHIPARARLIRRHEREYESLQKATQMEEKASSLRHVRVKGDAEKERQALREKVLSWLKIGMAIDTISLGYGTVLKINKKTATIGSCGASKTYTTNVPIHFLCQIRKEG
ncbi:hypothetical protein LCGC14_2629910 [marine sediment metagenome]|uniref:Uncharacterized protein n=1 Tax=marine sediment metagenome TaxID=412755 RepID=A0A0F9A0F9_9ZZZZ